MALLLRGKLSQLPRLKLKHNQLLKSRKMPLQPKKKSRKRRFQHQKSHLPRSKFLLPRRKKQQLK